MRAVTTSWPRVCLECRTALGPDEPCDACGAEPVVELRRAYRDRALWPRVRSPEARGDGRARGFGAYSTALLVLVIGATIYGVKHGNPWLGSAMFWGPVLWVASFIGWAVLSRGGPHRGAAVTPGPPASWPRVRGRVAAVEGPPARGFELRLEDGGVTLRHGETSGFVLEVGERHTVRVPAGRVRFEGPTEPSAGRPAEVDDAVPFARVHSWRVASGDLVELIAETVSEGDASAAYREPGRIEERAVGVPWIVIGGPPR